MERNCQKCIHHISGLCCKWDCEMQTLEDYRNKVIDEFAEKIKKKGIENAWNCHDVYGDGCGVTSCEECENDFLREIDEIAEQMKAGDNNERNII